MRGPSGAGKSTLVEREIIKDGCQAVICSVDRYFENGKEFDYRKLPMFHQKCMSQFLEALLMGVEHVIVDNTNIRRWEYRNYELVARLAKYKVEIIEVFPETVEEMRLCASRNVHGVPESTVAKFVINFESDSRAIRLPVSED